MILQIKGDLSEADDYSIAMVGTRMTTNYGKVQAERISAGLAEQNITVVSGMARGIDSISHSAALKQSGRTIAVIDSGLDVVYPPENNKLFNKISESGAMQTARFALDQNREVFAVPGNVGVKQAEGTNQLIQRGEAELITSADDVLLELELKLKPMLGKNIPRQQEELNLFEEKILDALNSEALLIDNIANATNLSTSDCLVHLLSLEFK